MRLMPKLIIAAVTGAAALAAAAFAGASVSAPQPPCSASDIDCRLTQIEASLARIERALDAGGGSGIGVSVAVADQYCGYRDCQSEAQDACTRAGFTRGAPADIGNERGAVYLRRATCLD